jgi:hypothetical protein
MPAAAAMSRDGGGGKAWPEQPSRDAQRLLPPVAIVEFVRRLARPPARPDASARQRSGLAISARPDPSSG